jgi:hypothetical protein
MLKVLQELKDNVYLLGVMKNYIYKTKNELSNYLISIIIDDKNKYHYLGYFNDEISLQTKIEELKMLNSTSNKGLLIALFLS